MSVTAEIWSTMANSTGLSFKEVSEIGRRIREHGHFSKHTKAKDTQVITDLDLANLTIAVLSGLPAQKTHIAIERLSASEIDPEDIKHVEEWRAGLTEIGDPAQTFLVPKHSFAQGLAALYGIARRYPHDFEKMFDITSVSIDQRRFTGKINLTAEIFDPLPKSIVDVGIGYGHDIEFFRGDLQSECSVAVATIAAVSRSAGRAAQ